MVIDVGLGDISNSVVVYVIKVLELVKINGVVGSEVTMIDFSFSEIDIEEASGIEDDLVIVLLVVVISCNAIVLDNDRTRPEVGPNWNP